MLADVDLEVRAGRRLCVLGSNGSGKTTLLRLASGRLRPGGGELTVHGRRVWRGGSDLVRRLAVVADRTAHYESLTGRENARVFLRAAGIDGRAASTTLGPLFDALALAHDADRVVGDYSLGMRRKLLLATALARPADLLLLDEPTLALDPPSVTALLDLLDARAASGAAVLYATHDARAAARADTVVFLHEGRIALTGEPHDLLERHGGGTRIEVQLGRALAGPVDWPALGFDARRDGLTLTVRTDAGAGDLPRLITALLDAGGAPSAVRVREPDLSDVFEAVTGRALEDEP